MEILADKICVKYVNLLAVFNSILRVYIYIYVCVYVYMCFHKHISSFVLIVIIVK